MCIFHVSFLSGRTPKNLLDSVFLILWSFIFIFVSARGRVSFFTWFMKNHLLFFPNIVRVYYQNLND